METPNFLKITLVAVALILPVSVEAASLAPSPDSQSFIEEASVANQFEIDSSRAALEYSQNNEVRNFAQQMIDNHTTAGQNMKAAIGAAKKDVIIREPEPGLDAMHRQILDDLKNASAEEFDKKYIDAQVEAHNQAVELFSNYSKNGDNQALKDFSAKTLPTLQMHKEKIDALASANNF